MKECFTSNDWKEIADTFVGYEELCKPEEVIRMVFEEHATYKGIDKRKRSFDKIVWLPEDLTKDLKDKV